MAVELVLSPTDLFFKLKPFDWDGRLFTTIADFEAYLAQPAARAALLKWARGVTVHHTWIPTVEQWKANGGYVSLKGMIREWRDVRGWSVGPNMVIAPEGIYLASGVDNAGIHAGVCNGTHVGIEIVGNYDKAYWPEPIRSFVFGAVLALVRTLGLSTFDVVTNKRVNGHKECLPNKSCPGDGIDLDRFRKDIAARMAITPTIDRTVIGVKPSITAAQFKRYLSLYHAPIQPGELDRIYMMCEWLDVDPAFLAALWKQESFKDDPTDGLPNIAIIGGSELQRQSHQPLNIVTNDAARAHINYANRMWESAPTWQLGLMRAVWHLKATHGSELPLRLTVREIIAVHSPAADGTPVETIVANIFTRMDEMKTL